MQQQALRLLITWVAAATQVALASPSPLCASFLEQENSLLARDFHVAADHDGVATAFCAAAGLGGSHSELPEGDQSLLSKLSAPAALQVNGLEAEMSLTPPHLGVDLQLYVIPGFELFADLAPLWIVETQGGGRALLDTGSDTTMIPHQSAGRDQRTAFTGVDQTRSIATDRADYWIGNQGVTVHGGLRSADIQMGLLGRDVLLQFGVLCADWSRRAVRFDHCIGENRRPLTLRLFETSDGSPIVAMSAGGEELTALIDTGTNISVLFTKECPAEATPTVPVDTFSAEPAQTAGIDSSVVTLDLDLGAPRTRVTESFLCEDRGQRAPYAILGMSFLSRFAAVELDRHSRTVTLYH